MKRKGIFGKIKLIVYMSAIVFFLVYISAVCFFSIYALIRWAPFLDIEKLPSHSGFYVLALISLIIGVILSIIFRNKVLVPLSQSYIALGKVADGDFKVSVSEKGIRSVRRIGKSVNIMAKELESIETMRSDFINNFSHEFKTPIISISGFAKMLKNTNLSEKEKEEYLDIIISESERLSQLSTNVLTLTKLNNQPVVTNVSEFNVTEQIRRAVILLEQKWSEKNLTINFDCSEYNIQGNEEQLSQIWINLLDNAIKHSPYDSEITVTIEKKSHTLFFRFTDRGKGMDEETQKHAFDRFFQADISHKSSGYGIGLAICKKICELHNGDIKIQKSDEKGTVFEVSLPA